MGAPFSGGNGSSIVSRPLLFALNGQRVEIASPDPSITLLSFLRSHTPFTGTKLSCGEGGCGACLVLLSTYDPKSKRVQESSINSCLALLCSLDGCSITTIEGLGSTHTGFHSVQTRVAGFHGSQCGFCTPGMCISLYSCLRKSHSPTPIANGSISSADTGIKDQHTLPTLPTLSCEDAQKAIVGNICRCTGYRPIVDACKSFAGDVDIEDLGINTFWASTEQVNANCLPPYDVAADPAFPDFLIKELDLKEKLTGTHVHNKTVSNGVDSGKLAVSLNVKFKDLGPNGEERSWIQTSSLKEVFEALQGYQGRRDVKLVVGNTSSGYYKDQNPRVFIDISHIPELLTLQESSCTLKVGAAVTIEKLISTLEAHPMTKKNSNGSVICGLASHLRKLANPHVRHRASVGGEAVYVDDVPSPDHCLYAAFVPSTKAFAKVKSIDTKLAIASSGVVAFISANDIPNGGANVAAVTAAFEPESLFATDYVEYVGHPLGIMVADSPEHAKEAAAKVRVEYEVESSPILCVEDAVAKNSFFPTSSRFPPKASMGDIEKGFLESDHKILNAEVKTGSQYYFYMETQTALAIPDEDNCMVVYNACQGPSVVQESISACLGIPHHNVRVITRRVGGGFGGKAFRNVTVASACAVAAHKLRRPVRMYLDRQCDMIMMGGRHPVKASYSVGFKHDGKLTAFKAKIYIDGGWSQDFTAFLHVGISKGLFKYNWGSLDIDYIACKTNLSSKSAMRGPGYLQGSFIADTVLEHVAAVLGLDVHTVISRNLHTIDSAALCYNTGATEDFSLPSIWNTMRKRMEEKERDDIKFNAENYWLKRGLSILPCVYDVFRAPIPARVSIFTDGSVVVEVGGIELGQGLWTKVKQATIYGLSPLWAKDEEGVELMKVRVVQADSMSLPHGGLTAHSTTSEGSCEAVTRACQLLVDRLMPLKVKKEELAGCLSWSSLIALAKTSQVDLSAQVRWSPEQNTFKYLTYGVAATEVEVNMLTGGVTILQSDLIYDCGKSLNPAVDIGQIEGSFVQGIGFFLTEEYEVDNTGNLVSNGTWTYKPPTVDNIPQKFCVEMVSSANRQNRVLSSKACGEPPLLMAGTVHSAVRRAIEAARKDHFTTVAGEDTFFRLDTPASMERVKSLCGLDRVEEYLNYQVGRI